MEPPPFGKYFLYSCLLLRIVGNRGMMYFLYLRMIIQILNNLQGIFHMTLYAKRQCLKALQEKECMDRERWLLPCHEGGSHGSWSRKQPVLQLW